MVTSYSAFSIASLIGRQVSGDDVTPLSRISTPETGTSVGDHPSSANDYCDNVPAVSLCETTTNASLPDANDNSGWSDSDIL